MHAVPLTDEFVRGAAELFHDGRGVVPRRLPGWVAGRGADEQVLMNATQPSGVRIAFRGEVGVVELTTIPVKRVYDGGAPRPDGVYDLVVDGQLVAQGSVRGGDVLRVVMAPRAEVGLEAGEAGVLRFEVPGTGVRDVEVWLPHDETTRLVEVRTDAPVEPVAARRTWLHHGSSISHGSNASHPTGTWPAVAARLAGWDLVNRGFGGSALLDPFTATHLRDTPADLVTLKIGINLTNTDLMRRRAFVPALHGFLDRVREGHPETPLWLVTPIFCPIHESTPGPAFPDPEAYARGELSFRAVGSPDQVAFGALTLEVVREATAEVFEQRRAEDPNLHLLSGLELYGPDDEARHPLPDGLHPVPETHQEMGTRFARLVLS